MTKLLTRPIPGTSLSTNEFLNEKLKHILDQKAPKKDRAKNEYELGLAYENGDHGLEKNNKLAVIWYKKASLNSHQLAQYKLAVAYHFNIDLQQRNLFLAKECYKKFLAHPGSTEYHASAQYHLAVIYEQGVHCVDNFPAVPIDAQKAFYFYNLASIEGSADASYNMALMYLNQYHKITTPADKERAIKETMSYLKRAATQGKPEALVKMEEIYGSGLVPRPETPKPITPLFKARFRVAASNTTPLSDSAKQAPSRATDEKERPPRP